LKPKAARYDANSSVGVATGHDAYNAAEDRDDHADLA
jgi:hypothetical protein